MPSTISEPIKLYEILVPCNRNDGTPIRTRHHRAWDEQIQRIAGGLTIFRPAVGKWVSPRDGIFIDRMIPVRIACTETQMKEVVKRTLNHYNDQHAVMYYVVSDEVHIVNRAKA